MVNGRKEVISLDRLKAAFMDKPIMDYYLLPPSLQKLPLQNVRTITHLGRRVRWPKHLK